MKIKKTLIRCTSLIIISLLMVLSVTTVQGYVETEQYNRFSKEELTQMLAPIALYPDSLLAQILMASTYPLEIVEAERWLHRYKELKGDALYNALMDKDWDTSVKSLCNFPDVLFALSEKIDQTRRLGDAFLSQEDEVMAVVQELRDSAYEKGNLRADKKQKVIVEREIIRIEPVYTHVIYVPVYDPLYVYGRWPYPSHPPYYWYYPSGHSFSLSYIHFGSPVFVEIGLFSWTWFDWPALHICISFNNANRYHRHVVYRDNDCPHWYHNPHHRRSVDYRDRDVREHFVQRPTRVEPKREDSPRISPEMEVRENHNVHDSSSENIISSHRGEEREEVQIRDDYRDRDEREVSAQRPPHITPVRDESHTPPIIREKIEQPYVQDEHSEDTNSPQIKPERERVQPEQSRDNIFTRITNRIEENRREEKPKNEDIKLSLSRTEKEHITQLRRDSSSNREESREDHGNSKDKHR